jgi:hypothetical protein
MDKRDKLIKKLEEALNKIAFPLKYLQNKAKEEGTIINGMMALSICQDANWLKQIAEDCLIEIASLKDEIEKEKQPCTYQYHNKDIKYLGSCDKCNSTELL